MSTGIYYFSGTGNTLQIARRLKDRLAGAEILPVIPILKGESVIPETESVGIIFPIQSFSYPWVAAEFLGKLDFSRINYVFAISSSHCFNQVFRDLEKVIPAGRKFDAYFAIEMPQNYIPMFKIPSPEQVKLADEIMEGILDSAAEVIGRREVYRPKDSPLWFPLSHMLFPLITAYFRKIRLPDMGRSFYTDDQCNGCGTCEKVCLMERIEIINGHPIWLDEIKCAYCFACLHLCPVQSVQIMGRKTERKRRYHHPSITAKDIIAQKYS
jgi:ferredoxin